MIECTKLQPIKPKEIGYTLDVSYDTCKLTNALSVLKASRLLIISNYETTKQKLKNIHDTGEKRAFVKHLVFLRKTLKRMANIECDLVLRIQQEHQKERGFGSDGFFISNK